MLDYQTPFGRAGALAGGAAGATGGGLLGRLGSLLEPLDYPRQALWNTLRSTGHAISGEGSWDDLAAAAPGLAGLGVAGGLAATGVGLPLAVLGGALMGGAGQAVGKATGRPEFQAATPEDVTGMSSDELPGMVANMAVGMVGDPLTYAGGIGGALKGADVGEQAGSALENLARARGPRYPGGLEKLQALLPGQGGHLNNILENEPQLARLLGEIPPGTQPLGQGTEAVAGLTPDGDVLRLGTGNLVSKSNPLPPPRPGAEQVLQPYRDVGLDQVRAERVPRANPGSWGHRETEDAMATLSRQLKEQGFNPRDIHPSNVGRLPDGSWKVIDAGAVDAPEGYTAPMRTPTQQPNWLQNKMLDLLGADRGVQGELSELAAPSRDVSGGRVGANMAEDVTPGRTSSVPQGPSTPEQPARGLSPRAQALLDQIRGKQAASQGVAGRFLADDRGSLDLDVLGGWLKKHFGSEAPPILPQGVATNDFWDTMRRQQRDWTPEQLQAHGSYTSSSHFFNQPLRAGMDPSIADPSRDRAILQQMGYGPETSVRQDILEQYRNSILHLDSTMQPHVTGDSPLLLHRGFTLPDVKDPLSLVGQTIHDPGFLSSSVNPEKAQGFGPLFGSFPYDPATPSTLGHPTQQEVILPRGTSFKVLEAAKDQGRYRGQTNLLMQLQGHGQPLPQAAAEANRAAAGAPTVSSLRDALTGLMTGRRDTQFENPNKWVESAVKVLKPEDWQALAQSQGMSAGKNWRYLMDDLKNAMWSKF